MWLIKLFLLEGNFLVYFMIVKVWGYLGGGIVGFYIWETIFYMVKKVCVVNEYFKWYFGKGINKMVW